MTNGPWRILIVDDSLEDRTTYRRRLMRDNPAEYVFWETALGEEGLRICRQDKPDCVLLDYNLPDLDGLTFIDRLRAQDGDVPTPVVMLTGQGKESVAVEALRRGAQDYMVKQEAANNLWYVIHRAVERVALTVRHEEGRREIQQLAEELQESNRRKDEFLAVLAHELRNPLGPIRNAARILASPAAGDASHAEARQVIERQSAHMGRLIDDLLDVSRIARGKVLLRRQLLDLTELVRVTAEDHRQSIEAAGLSLKVDLPGTFCPVDGDPTRLTQVVGNLLHNASKFTDPGGSIHLWLECAGDEVTLTVVDTGIGMEPSMLAHAFESFNQADRSLDRSRGGLGLGLALSKGLVDLHGGKINASSDGLGKGCRIRVMLRLHDARLSPTQAPSFKQPNGHFKRVLVIEDQVDAAKMLATLLRVYGHEPFVAHTGPEGLRLAAECRPEVVLCDIGLPGGTDGYAVARALRANPDLASACLIAVTGYGQDNDLRQARDAGFDLHLVKPIDPARLEEVLANLPVAYAHPIQPPRPNPTPAANRTPCR